MVLNRRFGDVDAAVCRKSVYDWFVIGDWLCLGFIRGREIKANY